MSAGPLTGRRVVVTRAADQADALADLLTAHGAVPVVVPLIDVVPVPKAVQLLETLRPSEFDWLVVTSPNGAAAYLEVHRAAPRSVAAVGSATAAVLENGGLTVALMPAVQRASGLLEEMPSGQGRVLLVQAVDAEMTMLDGLRAKGYQVTAVSLYRTVSARPGAALQLAALSADAVLFASGSAARAWVAVFGLAAPPIVIAIGPQTAAATQATGLKVAGVAADHSLPGLVHELERHITRLQ